MESDSLDDAATHSLHALPNDEARDFDGLVASNLELEEDLDSFRRVAAHLIDGLPDIVPAASPALWDRISEGAGISEPTSAPAETRAIPIRPLAMMGAAAILIAVLGVGAVSLLDRDSAPDPVSLVAAAAQSPDALNVNLTSPAGIEAINAQVVIRTDGTGFLVADSLPKLNADRTYQLWLIVDDRVISAAILGNDPSVVQFRAEGTVAGIAISNEVAGGVVVSEEDPTALWLSDTI